MLHKAHPSAYAIHMRALKTCRDNASLYMVRGTSLQPTIRQLSSEHRKRVVLPLSMPDRAAAAAAVIIMRLPQERASGAAFRRSLP